MAKNFREAVNEMIEYIRKTPNYHTEQCRTNYYILYNPKTKEYDWEITHEINPSKGEEWEKRAVTAFYEPIDAKDVAYLINAIKEMRREYYREEREEKIRYKKEKKEKKEAIEKAKRENENVKIKKLNHVNFSDGSEEEAWVVATPEGKITTMDEKYKMENGERKLISRVVDNLEWRF